MVFFSLAGQLSGSFRLSANFKPHQKDVGSQLFKTQAYILTSE
jgi:hypothetical protein